MFQLLTLGCVAEAQQSLTLLEGVGEMKSKMILLAFVLAFGGVAQAQTTHIILAEDFEGLPLGESPEEAAGTPDVWTDTPPPGWFNDESGVPGVGTAADGVTDWAGWAFTNKDWWVQIAGDQRRSEFTLGQGTVAVADPDEWDDSGTPGNIADDPYDTWLSTRPIELGTSKAGTAQLRWSRPDRVVPVGVRFKQPKLQGRQLDQ